MSNKKKRNIQFPILLLVLFLFGNMKMRSGVISTLKQELILQTIKEKKEKDCNLPSSRSFTFEVPILSHFAFG